MTKLTFEGAVERRLGFVTDLSCDLRNATARGVEHLRSELKAPAGQVGNGRLRQITPEALGQYGTRNSYIVRERRNRPRMCWLAMQQGQFAQTDQIMRTPRLMAVLAHPDDESLGVGGTLAKYASEGVDVLTRYLGLVLRLRCTVWDSTLFAQPSPAVRPAPYCGGCS